MGANSDPQISVHQRKYASGQRDDFPLLTANWYKEVYGATLRLVAIALRAFGSPCAMTSLMGWCL